MMKRYINLLLKGWVFLMIIGLASCEDYLDKAPESEISKTDAFVNFYNFQGFVEELYCAVPDITTANWSCDWNLGDEVIERESAVWLNTAFDKGDYWAWTNTNWISYLDKGKVVTGKGQREQGLWPNAWYAIRKANLGLENLDNMVDATQEERDLIEGQLLFFRAWFHFKLMSFWGGLPYLDRALGSVEKLELPRLSYQECADKAAVDFERAAELLPTDWDGTVVGKDTEGNNQQRITKIMALAYAGKNYLYAGSPLMNYESTGSKTFNAEYCKKAADVFGELLKIVDAGQTNIALLNFSDYSALFYTDGRSTIPGGIGDTREAIFQCLVNGEWFKGCPWGPSALWTEANIGGGAVCPNARFVENYGMANGLPIDDPNSGYDANDPWANRDPRFYHDIIIDGDQVISGSAPADKEQFRYAQLFTGGASRQINKSGRSGYLLSKVTPMRINEIDGFNGNYMHLSYMRLADVYLMYAEAVLQGYGSAGSSANNYTLTAEGAFNKIRERAGAGIIDARYSGNKGKFMDEIIRERAMELGFEGDFRFQDLRRWLLAEKQEYKEKTAVEFDRGADGKPVNYRERVVLTRVFEQKHYWLPLKVSDVTLYPSFGQNPGW